MKKRQAVVFLAYIVLIGLECAIAKQTEDKPGTCVWYGECPQDDQVYNCKYDGPAKTVSQEGYNILRKLCPHLDAGSIENTRTCCDLDQLQTLKRQIALLSDFTRRCPACDVNLRAFFCQMTCGHDQSEYMSVAKEMNKSIVRLNLSVSYDYVSRIIDSCRNVQFQSGGQNVLDVICQKDAEYCMPPDLTSVFSRNSPFGLVIDLASNTSAMSTDVWKCNVPIKYHALSYPPCSCSDCQSSCPSSCPFKKESQFVVGSLDAFVFVALMIWLAICNIIFFTCVISSIRQFYRRVQLAHTTCNAIPEEEGEMLANDVVTEPDENTPLLENEVDIGSTNIMYHEMFGHLCARCGRMICNLWYLFAPLGLVLGATLTTGVFHLNMTTDPNILWSVRRSRALSDKRRFDDTFGPFFRTTQVLLKSKNDSVFYKSYASNPFMVYAFSDALSIANMRALSELQRDIEQLVVRNISLRDVCYKPVSDEKCAVFSPMEFFQNNVSLLDLSIGCGECGNLTADWASHLLHCFRSPLSTMDPDLNISCLARHQGPVQPFLAVAGYEDSTQPSNCSSLLLTYLLDSTNPLAAEWEKGFIEFMALRAKKEEQQGGSFQLVYSAERSIEDQIEIESWVDVKTIAFSYILMFVYVTIALSFFSRPLRLLSGLRWWAVAQCKVSLSMGSIALVLLAVASSVGLLAYAGVPTTMLVFEVLPFLILAVGVDNTFILCRQCQLCAEHLCPLDAVANTLHKVGPGLILANMAEVGCFVLAALLSDVYAVRLFAMNAAIALVLNIVLQALVFVPLLYLDSCRVHAGRPDILCCFSLGPSSEPESGYGPIPALETEQRIHIPKIARILIVSFFLFVPCVVIAMLAKLPVGLEPSITVPSNSYVQKYLDEVKTLNVGPPFFIVVENLCLNGTEEQNSVCGGVGCRSDSLMAQLAVAEVCANVSWVARAPSSWLDGYFDWVSTEGCCRVDDKGQFCRSDDLSCDKCRVRLNNLSRPVGDDFFRYIPFYTQDNPNEQCPFGGHPLHKMAISPNASYFMGYHSTLRQSSDFVSALRRSWEIVDRAYSQLKRALPHSDLALYSYSVFYVFYEQYLSMHRQLYISIAVSLGLIFLLSFALTGFDLVVGLAVTITCWAILIDLLGLMIAWSVSLNAISIVNLVMSIGIAVEFCAHIAMNFARNRYVIAGPADRALNSVKEIGSSVFTGIGLTKLIGISVLAFAQSQIFTIYFFRMYLGLVLFGLIHGMIFLPFLLSLIGPGKDPDSRRSGLPDLRYVTLFPDDAEDSLE